MKKLIAVTLATVMLFALCACGGETKEETVLENVKSTDPLTKEDVIQICIRSHPSWPYDEDWKVWQYIEEGCGATLNVNAVPESEYATKLTLMFTDAKTVPDIAVFNNKNELDKYSRQGAVIAVEDVKECMPNLMRFYSSLSEDEYSQKVNMSRSADGKQYFIPNFVREKTQNVRAWLYRKDIFDKHGISVPTSFDELYEVCKKLKEIYPDSYPFAVRSKLANLNVTGSSWKPYWEISVYYDYENEKWSYGALEETMLNVLTFYNKMINEELLMSNFMNISNANWQELITTDRGFIMPEYQTRIDFFNSLCREKNPEFNLTAMVPPVADAENGVAMVNKYNYDPYGLAICNSVDEKRIINAAKYIDWLYTDEAVELVSWGKEGETFEIKDGKKMFIQDENRTQIQTLYGFNSYGSFSKIDSDSVLTSESEDIAETRDMVLEHTMPYFNPLSFVAFTDEEAAQIDKIGTGIDTYFNENIHKFIIGQKPLSEFDEFRNELKNLGVDELLSIYESAYNRMK